MVAELPGQERMRGVDVEILAGGKRFAMIGEQFERGVTAITGGHAAPPTWEELSGAFAAVDRIRTRIKVAKDQVKDRMADLGLVELQEEVKELKEELQAAEGVRDELGQRMRAARVNAFTGEVRD